MSAPTDAEPPAIIDIDVRGPGGEPAAQYRIVEDGDYLVGRDRARAHLLIDDKSVSRRHALVRRTGARLMLADLGSLNGTALAGDVTTMTVGDGVFSFRDWPEGIAATIGVFTLQWRGVSDHHASHGGERVRRQIAYPVWGMHGRLRMRLLLFVAVVLPVSIVVGLVMGDWKTLDLAPLALAAALLGVGLLLDPLYRRLQRWRSSPDWLTPWRTAGLGLEFAIALTILRADLVPGIDTCRLARIDRLTRQLVCVDYALPLSVALIQFAAIFLLALIAERATLEVARNYNLKRKIGK